MSLDRLSNMLSALKNASMAGKPFIEIYHTKECESVAKVLKNEGFLSEVKVFKEKGSVHKGLHLGLTIEDGSIRLEDIKRYSKPGRRLYSSSGSLDSKSFTHGITVVSTSKGIMSSREAKRKKLGGELICRVY